MTLVRATSNHRTWTMWAITTNQNTSSQDGGGSDFESYLAAFRMYLLISVKCTQEKLSVVARFIIHPEGLRHNGMQ